MATVDQIESTRDSRKVLTKISALLNVADFLPDCQYDFSDEPGYKHALVILTIVEFAMTAEGGWSIAQR